MSASNVFTYNNGLAVLYAILFIFEGLQLFRIFYYRHKKKSFQVGFLSLCFFWNLLRVLFFAWLLTSSNKTLIIIVYWIPINIQFATFSLLVVFYAHLHHTQKSEWYALKRRYIGLYVILNALFFILAVVWMGLGMHYDQSEYHDEKEPAWLDKIHSGFTGIVFLLLSCVIGYHGWKAAGLTRHTDYAQPKLVGKLSYPRILSVAFLLFLVFTVRCVYDLLLTTNLVETWYVEVTPGTSAGAGFTFLIFFSFEIIPIILVMILFGRVKSTTLGVFSRTAQKSQPNLSNFKRQANLVVNTESTGSGPHLLKADLFNNPLRYDSDDENTPFKNSPVQYGTHSPYPVASPIRSLNDDLVS